MNPNERFTNFAISRNFHIDTDRRKVIDDRDKSEYDYDMDSKILIYEDRVSGWFLQIAEDLKKDQHAGFVILMIATSYLESNQQFREGRSSEIRESSEFVRRALKRIFPEIQDAIVDKLLNQVRHGFFHDGIARKDIFISCEPTEVLTVRGDSILINPHLFLDAIKNDLDEYIQELKDSDNEDLREKFETYWNIFKGI